MVIEARLQSVRRMALSTKKSVSQGSPFKFVKKVIFQIFVQMYILYQGEGGYSMPVYFGPPHTIWGLTAIVTFQLLRALLPTNLYNHKLLFQSAVRKP